MANSGIAANLLLHKYSAICLHGDSLRSVTGTWRQFNDEWSAVTGEASTRRGINSYFKKSSQRFSQKDYNYNNSI